MDFIIKEMFLDGEGDKQLYSSVPSYTLYGFLVYKFIRGYEFLLAGTLMLFYCYNYFARWICCGERKLGSKWRK